MTVRKLDVQNSTWRVGSGLYGAEWGKPISPQKMSALLTKAKADKTIGKLGAEALKLAYREARTKAGADPTNQQVRAQIDKAASSLSNEKKKGRINDGYVDTREAALTKGDLAAALYKFVDEGPANRAAPTPKSQLSVKASFAKIDQAIKNLSPIIDKGVAAYDPNNDDSGEGLADALRAAATAAGLSSRGRAAILTALNGATSRGDWGDSPTAADVKSLLTSAQAKLKQSDGAKLVDFAHPEKAPKTYADGVVYGVELDRTPAATGMTSRALLAYAATL
jgi:hypothetical protein